MHLKCVSQQECGNKNLHENTSRGVNSNLLIKFMVGQRQLDSFPHLLFLHIHPTNIGVRHVRFLICDNNYAINIVLNNVLILYFQIIN